MRQHSRKQAARTAKNAQKQANISPEIGPFLFGMPFWSVSRRHVGVSSDHGRVTECHGKKQRRRLNWRWDYARR